MWSPRTVEYPVSHIHHMASLIFLFPFMGIKPTALVDFINHLLLLTLQSHFHFPLFRPRFSIFVKKVGKQPLMLLLLHLMNMWRPWNVGTIISHLPQLTISQSQRIPFYRFFSSPHHLQLWASLCVYLLCTFEEIRRSSLIRFPIWS